jgi:hypothetical protein
MIPNHSDIEVSRRKNETVQQETAFLVRYYNIFDEPVGERLTDTAPSQKSGDQFGETGLRKTSWSSYVYMDGELIAVHFPRLLDAADIERAFRKLYAYAQHRPVSVIEFFKSETYTMLKRGYAGMTPSGHLVPLTDLSALEKAA